MRNILYFFLCFLALSSSVITSAQDAYGEYRLKQQVVTRTNSDWARQQPYVVMISMDGFRYDYAEKFGAKNILEIGKNGAVAARMFPAYPSKTFPNHYTLVTGLYPGNHGLVSNEFYSRSRGQWYEYKKKETVLNGDWYSGIPLWVLAEQQGMMSASFFWVGSEAAIQGVRPSYTYAYDASIPNDFRIRQIIDWLKLPEAVRPHIVLGYFSLVDDLGHRYGPDHAKTREGVLQLDSLIGVLKTAIDAMDLPVHLVLVSDHGMTSIDRGVVLPEVVDLGDSKVSYSFPPMIYQQDAAEVDRIYRTLLQSGVVDVYKKGAVPAYLNFVNEDRVGDLVLATRPPLVILDRPRQVSGGTHGYDPFTVDEMGAIFYAWGPRLRSGVKLPAFENVDVYPFVAEILGLKITQPIDGKYASLEVLFK